MSNGIKINLMGKRFGRLIVIKQALKHPLIEQARWECQCDCGNMRIINSSDLRNGKQISCGCAKTAHGNLSKRWKGHGDISGTYFRDIKAGAKRRNLPFELTLEYLWNLFIQQQSKCALSNLYIQFSSYYKNPLKQTASLDRIDNDKGYIKGNVRWVHKAINNMRLDLPDDIFIYLCHQISKNNSMPQNIQPQLENMVLHTYKKRIIKQTLTKNRKINKIPLDKTP